MTRQALNLGGILAVIAAIVLVVWSLLPVSSTREDMSQDESSGEGENRSSKHRAHAIREASSAKETIKEKEYLSRAEKAEMAAGWKLGKYSGQAYNLQRLSTLGPDGKLTNQVIEYAGLAKDDVNFVQNCFNLLRGEMNSILMSNVVRENVENDSSGVISKFRIRAFPVEGTDSYERFINKLDGQIGVASRNRVLSGYSVSANYLSFGRWNADVEIVHPSDGSGNRATEEILVKIDTTDLRGAERVGSQTMALATAIAVYGDVIAINLNVNN